MLEICQFPTGRWRLASETNGWHLFRTSTPPQSSFQRHTEGGMVRFAQRIQFQLASLAEAMIIVAAKDVQERKDGREWGHDERTKSPRPHLWREIFFEDGFSVPFLLSRCRPLEACHGSWGESCFVKWTQCKLEIARPLESISGYNIYKEY